MPTARSECFSRIKRIIYLVMILIALFKQVRSKKWVSADEVSYI